MLPNQYCFRSSHARDKAKWKLEYKRRPNGPPTVRKFKSPTMAFERVRDLVAAQCYTIDLSCKSNKGNFARVWRFNAGKEVYRSELRQHQFRRRWVINPTMLDPSRKQIRKDIKAKYGIAYISKNKELNYA